MKLITFFSVIVFLVTSCSQTDLRSENQNSEKKNKVVEEPKEELPEEKRTVDFYCEIDGKEMKSNKRYCIRKPQFSHYDFWFLGANVQGDIHIMLDFSMEDKTIPFKVEMKKDTDKNYGARIHYEVPPDGYSTPKELNTITVTAWDKEKHTISMDFEGYVGNSEGTQYYHVKGYLNNLSYEYFE